MFFFSYSKHRSVVVGYMAVKKMRKELHFDAVNIKATVLGCW